jgi:hypothetical protein
LGIVIKSPAGIVLAADSRLTLMSTNNDTKETFPVHFDNATKLLRFGVPNNFVGAVTFGQAIVEGTGRTAESFLPEFEARVQSKGRIAIPEFAKELSEFYAEQWAPSAANYTGQPMVFIVGGYDEAAPYGRVFSFAIPQTPAPTELNVDDFGCTWGGQTSTVDRIYRGFDQGLPNRVGDALDLTPAQRSRLQEVLNPLQLSIPVPVMALQDCVDLAVTLIRTTIAMQQLTVELRGVGGPIDVVTITRTQGLQTVKFKEVRVDA